MVCIINISFCYCLTSTKDMIWKYGLAFCRIDSRHPCHGFTQREFEYFEEKRQDTLLFRNQNNQSAKWLGYCRLKPFGKSLMLIDNSCPSSMCLGEQFLGESRLTFFDYLVRFALQKEEMKTKIKNLNPQNKPDKKP